MDGLKTTPMMEQWTSCKKRAKEALLFFRLGDFYEAFFEDADIISKELDLTLTKRQNMPMCGVPYHACDGYIDKLIAKGYKVAIAEQTEDPKLAKGLVKREIVRILTPATIVDSSLIVDKSNNFFVSISKTGSIFALAAIDISTAELKTIELENEKDLKDEIFKLKPKEFLISKKLQNELAAFFEDLGFDFKFILNVKEDWFFDLQSAKETLLNHFKVQTLEGFGLKNPSVIVVGALFTYLKDELSLDLSNLQRIKIDSSSKYMGIDYICMRNLELVESLFYKDKKNTLLECLDQTQTPMGGRLIKEWIKHPLLCCKAIAQREDALEELLKNFDKVLEIDTILGKIKDLERLFIKISGNFASPKEYVALSLSLEEVTLVKRGLKGFSSELLKEALELIFENYEAIKIIKGAIVENPPFRLSDGNVFKEGYNSDLDELKNISKESKTWIANYQNNLKNETGIKTLKVGFTNAFGYYIEVSRGQANKIPPLFQRKQTLINSERFTTEELKDFEHKILSAEDRIKALEAKLFFELKALVMNFAEEITRAGRAISLIDTLISLTKVAKSNNYTRPLVDESDSLFIEEGRHPIVEKNINYGSFISNNSELDSEKQLILITGPNMAGKSTYIRQVALIAIMAQIGSFVPAKSLHMGIIDKVFSRIGASDDIAKGQSTFMVEMTETANILNNATSKSLVILDEIGRGTSTFDGISIAWAVAKYLLTKIKAKTLFATHYWELTELEEKIKGAINYNVAIQETNEGIVFLHKIVKGRADKSYGIHVAKLAGLPPPVIKEANRVLEELEAKSYKPLVEQLLLFK